VLDHKNERYLSHKTDEGVIKYNSALDDYRIGKCRRENTVGVSRGDITLTAQDPQPIRSAQLIVIKTKGACSYLRVIWAVHTICLI
jgi:hypothetical protein